ncbi:unnamed protein product [Rhizophagus irregularis]|nr:unnamed protein product [Rhizophagus irregularis]
MTNYIAKGKHSKGFEFTTTEHFSPSAAENLRNGGRSSSGIIYKREEKYVYGKTCGCGQRIKPYSNKDRKLPILSYKDDATCTLEANEWLHENKSNTSGFDCEWQVFPKQ